jgi:hypothetical protein
MTAPMRPSNALIVGFGALIVAAAAAVSAAPHLIGWAQLGLGPPIEESAFVARGGDAQADFEARLRALAAGHGIAVEAMKASLRGDAVEAEMIASGDEARVMQWIAAVEQARPAVRIMALDLRRKSMAPDGAAQLQVRVTLGGRHRP